MKTENELCIASKPDEKEAYEAPVIEIVEVMVEHGFQASAGGDLSDDPNDGDDPDGTY